MWRAAVMVEHVGNLRGSRRFSGLSWCVGERSTRVISQQRSRLPQKRYLPPHYGNRHIPIVQTIFAQLAEREKCRSPPVPRVQNALRQLASSLLTNLATVRYQIERIGNWATSCCLIERIA